MKALTFAIVAIATLPSVPARADEATLARAVATYNDLPAKVRAIALETDSLAEEQSATRIPAWLAKAGLTEREAAAAAAAFGVYGNDYMINYRSRAWTTPAWIAGGVAETVLGSNGSVADPRSNQPPSRALTEWRRTRMVSAMKDMGTCSGALAGAVRKAVALRAGDDATRLLAKAQRDLGAAALPPDTSCLS